MPGKTSRTVAASIDREITLALHSVCESWSAAKVAEDWSEVDDDALTWIEIELAIYSSRLAIIERTAKGKIAKRIAYACGELLHLRGAKIAAIIRSMNRVKQNPMPSRVLEIADGLDARMPLREPVRVKFQPKSGGAFRPICSFSPLRIAQQLMLRDALQVAGLKEDQNFARKGGGGEKALINKTCTLIDKGSNWWWTPDIKSAFACMRPGHFKWMGLDRRLLLNVCFLPKCAKIEVIMPDDQYAFVSWLSATHGDHTDHDVMSMARTAVRRGLPQGSVLSPLLANALIAHLWCQSVSDDEVTMHSVHDDLVVGAKTEAKLTSVKETVTKNFASLPAGPIQFHDAAILHAKSRKVTLLGYRLEPGRGYMSAKSSKRPVHVKPGLKRIKKRRAKLKERLEAAPAGTDLMPIGLQYNARWFASQTAWTKVPEYSRQVSENFCISEVISFEGKL